MTKSKNPKTKKKSNISNDPSGIKFDFNSILENQFLGLYIGAVFCVVMLIISFTFHKIGDYGVETDFYQAYVPVARDFLNGIITIDPYKGPVYQIVLGSIGFIAGDLFRAGIIICVLSASIFIYFSFEVLKKLFSVKEAIFVISLLIFNPVFIQFTYSAGTDMFFAALLSVAFYFLFKNDELNYKNLVIAALISGIAYLTRYNGVFLLGFVAVILFVNYWKLDWKKRIISSLVYIGTFLLTITPWGIYCLNKKGSFFYNENYRNIAYELYGKGKINWDQFWYSSVKEFTSLPDVIFKDPILFISNSFQNIYTHFTSDLKDLLGWHIGAFVILGLIFFIYNNPVKNWESRKTGYYLMNLFFFLVLLIVFYSERFSMFLLPCYLAVAVSGMIGENFSLKRLFSKTLVYFLFVFLFAFSAYKTYAVNSRIIDSGPGEILVLRDWYLSSVPENKRGKNIAARKPQVAYYLNMQFNAIPLSEDYNDFISKLRKDKDDYLYFSPMEAQTRPQLQYLLNPKVEHPGLKPVVYFENPPAVLYKVLDVSN